MTHFDALAGVCVCVSVVCLPACLSVCLPVCLLSACLPVCLSVTHRHIQLPRGSGRGVGCTEQIIYFFIFQFECVFVNNCFYFFFLQSFLGAADAEWDALNMPSKNSHTENAKDAQVRFFCVCVFCCVCVCTCVCFFVFVFLFVS